jgi:hypothetical protein
MVCQPANTPHSLALFLKEFFRNDYLLPWRSGSHHAYKLPDQHGRLESQRQINEINRSGVRLATEGPGKRSVANRAESIKKEPPVECFLSTGGLALRIC